MKIKIVFMGSPDFALPILRRLNQEFNVVGVVTQPDRPAGRGREEQPPAVKVLAQDLGLPLIQPKTLKEESVFNQLEAWAPDVIIVAAFGQILRENVLNLPTYGCVNVHASLLPRWRGAAPIQAALLHDDVTGVTIMKMDKGLDTGPILRQREMFISEEMTAGSLFDKLAQIGADLLVETLPQYLSGEIMPRPQNDALATYAPRLKREDGLIDFNQPAAFLARKVRAYNPWPGAYQFWGDTRIKVFSAHAKDEVDISPGTPAIVDDQPAWGTRHGLLVMDQLQMAGKQHVSGAEFLNGAKDWLSHGNSESKRKGITEDRG